MDQSFIHIEVNSLEVRVLPRQFDLLARGRHFDGLSEPEHFDALIKMLAIEVHEIVGLMLLEASIKMALIVYLSLLVGLILASIVKGLTF